MPLNPPPTPFSTITSPPLSQMNYSTPPTSVSVSIPNYDMSPQIQPQVVTTPISLPGMPPITVSASVPQNPTFCVQSASQ